MSGDPLYEECAKCGRGAEACAYCADLPTREDWQAICDCGLYDFTAHLFACTTESGRVDAKGWLIHP